MKKITTKKKFEKGLNKLKRKLNILIVPEFIILIFVYLLLLFLFIFNKHKKGDTNGNKKTI